MGTVQIDGSTPKITVGNATAEDATILFDGNAQDFYIALDDSADDLLIGLGSTVGTTPIIAIDENKLSTFSGAVTVGVDDTGHDVKLFGATSGSFLLWDESANALLLTDSTPIQIGDAQDLTLYHDGSNSYITNAVGALKIATETSGIAITLGHTTSEVTVADNFTVTGTITLADGSLALADLDIDGGTDIGAALVDADLFIVDDGAGGTNRKTTASRIATYIGDNTPAFSVNAGSTDQEIDHNTWTKVTLGTEDFDSDSAFGSDKFTVPTGAGGKYVFGYGTAINNVDDTEKVQVALYKNGSVVNLTQHRVIAPNSSLHFVKAVQVLVLSADDYIELYTMHEEGAAQDANSAHCFLYGYRILGA